MTFISISVTFSTKCNIAFYAFGFSDSNAISITTLSSQHHTS